MFIYGDFHNTLDGCKTTIIYGDPDWAAQWEVEQKGYAEGQVQARLRSQVEWKVSRMTDNIEYLLLSVHWFTFTITIGRWKSSDSNW